MRSGPAARYAYPILIRLPTEETHDLFVAQSFRWWDGDGVAGRQQAGEECAESEKRRSCEQAACGKTALHPMGEDGAEKTVQRKTDDYPSGRADERDARGHPKHV